MTRNARSNKNKKKSPKSRAKPTARTRSGLADAVTIPRQVRPAAPRPKHGKTAMVEAVCAITDPFCPRAKNAKWPDGMGGNTLTMQSRIHRNIGTLANGGRLCYAGASLPFSFLQSTSTSAGNYTMTNLYEDMTVGSNFSSYVDTYRVVTWGVIIRNVLPALTASGYVTISRMTVMPPESSVIAEGQVVGGQVETHPLCAGSEIYIIGKPQGTGARAFNTKNTTTTTDVGWEVLKIEISGGPTSAGSVIDLEFVYNVEFTLPLAQSALHGFTTPVAPVAPKAIEASQLVHSRANTIVAGGLEKVTGMVTKHAATAAEDILAGALGWLGL